MYYILFKLKNHLLNSRFSKFYILKCKILNF
nr:MAG TPA: hypothetical protein [Caudoviricetes sp.]